MQSFIRCDRTFQLHFCRSHRGVDIQFFFSQPAFGDTDITYHAVHTIRPERTLLIGSFHAAVDSDMLFDDLRTHTHSNDRGSNANGMV